MSSLIVDVVNIDNATPLSYLELGTGDGVNFKQIKWEDKISVDINGKATYTMTTDEFFKQNTRTFDIVFIDANHDFDYVVRDYINSIKICKKVLIIHDMFPVSEILSHSKYCSDSYKLLAYFVDSNFNYKTVKHDHGLTLLSFPFKELDLNLLEKYRNLPYQEFIRLYTNKINFYQSQYA